MSAENFTMDFLVNQSPEEVFGAVTNVRGWWSEMLEGASHNAGDEFVYRHKDVHYSKQKLIEVIPNQKVVWLVTDSNLNFIEQHDEWTGTTVVFEISREGDKTKLHFTHRGLTPAIKCFGACSGGWTYYLKGSLLPLITEGLGKPDKAV